MEYYLEAFRKYAVFSGRSRRKEYWMYVLINFLISVVLSFLDLFLRSNVLNDAYTLIVLIPSFAVLTRRLHDTGRSAWWLLILLIPLIGLIVVIVFACMDSQPGTNAYGPNPKEPMQTPPTPPVPPAPTPTPVV